MMCCVYEADTEWDRIGAIGGSTDIVRHLLQVNEEANCRKEISRQRASGAYSLRGGRPC